MRTATTTGPAWGARILAAAALAAVAAAVVVTVCVSGAAADEPTVRAEVDRNHIGRDDRITFEVVVEGRVRSIEEPQLPVFEDFDVYGNTRSQSMQIVNGVMSVQTAFIYVLAPKREGTLTIGSVLVRVSGREYKTAPITVTVGGAPSARGAPEPPPGQPETREDRDIFVVAHADKPNAYVNEQLLYTFYLYRADRSAQITNLNYAPPKFQGFWVEKLKDSEKQSYKVINNRRYIVTEVSTALFPTTSGKLVIEPAKLQLVLLTSPYGFGFFDRGVERVLATKAVEIDVSPLPVAGRPAGFEGAVGEALQLSAQLDRTEVAEGDPVTLTLRVEGTGNVKTFSRPRLPDLPQFKIYDADSKTSVETMDRVAGSRTWETVLVPKDEGEHAVPPIRLSYFDTREGSYRTLETKPMTITAVRGTGSGATTAAVSGLDAPPAQQDIQILGRDIAHIRTDVAVSDTWTPLYRRGLFDALATLPFLAVVGATLRRRRQERFASDVALARSSRARKLASKRLAAARKAQEANRGEAFYAEISRALHQFTGDKLNVAAIGMTQTDLRAAVVASGAHEDTASRLVELLERCDAARFAPGSMGAQRLRETLHDAESLIVELDGQLTRRASAASSTAAVSGLLLVATAVAVAAGLLAAAPAAQAQGQQQPQPSGAAPGDASTPISTSQDFASPAEWLQRGHAAYESKRFEDAITAYSQAERAGVRNGGLYFDLGNAYFKNGNLAQAIAAYRRAEMLSPRDGQIRSNLAFARARREDKAVQSADMPLVAWIKAVFRGLSLNEWLGLCAALYAAACAVWIVRVLRGGRSRVLRGAVIGIAIVLVLAASLTAAKVQSERRTQYGVVTDSRIAVKSGPGTEYTAEFSLHEGAEVRVEARRADWVRIAVTDKLQGWVPASSVLEI